LLETPVNRASSRPPWRLARVVFWRESSASRLRLRDSPPLPWHGSVIRTTRGALLSTSHLGGTTIAGRYAILEPLGAGGSAHVYLAHDAVARRDVAIKILRSEFAGARSAQRFLREIALLTALDHPGILPLYDYGEFDGVPYFVTTYASGGSLRARLIETPFLPLDDALRILNDVAAALDYAHGHHVIHRDIKPENIVFDAERALLADFGIARALDAAVAERLTDSQVGIGTPAYMSPEQCVGGASVDAATDIYALGVVAYEMLTGCVPFSGPTPQVIYARKTLDPVPSIRTVRASIPPHVEDAITRALAAHPDGRFASAGDFVRALERVWPAGRGWRWWR
jgi:serine/threonine-protein kinase